MSISEKQTCLIIAGELSGEEHSQSFFEELQILCPDVEFFGVGGEYLESRGVDLIYHLRDFSSWGLNEVIGKIALYLKAFKVLESEVKKRNCKKAILIDYQTFNLKLALKLKSLDVDVLYYVAPQAWAWKAWRAPYIAKAAHTLFCLLPFEKKWFMDRGVKKVISIAHPLFKKHQKALDNLKPKSGEIKRLLLLPGSRKNEIKFLYPKFLSAAKVLKETYGLEVSLVKASSLPDDYFQAGADVVDHFYDASELELALSENDMAFAASGTVTLSCGLFSVPTIVCYGVSLFEEFIFKQFVNYTGDVSLSNIIHQKRLFPEILGDRVNVDELIKRGKYWIEHNDEYIQLIKTLDQTKTLVEGENINIAEYMSSVIKGEI